MATIDPEIGFTSDVIRDPKRFVGRSEVIRDCIKSLNSPLGLIAVYGKRGVGKSSLLRQVQQMALADYTLAKDSGLYGSIPDRPRKYVTVYYTCDSMIKTAADLLKRLCNDQNSEDGLLRLVPNDGKEIVEFSRSAEHSIGVDLKVIDWGAKGIAESKYARVVDGDIVQTFRNFVSSIVQHQVKRRLNRDSLLILLDEFDVIQDKSGLGSLIKSLSSPEVKFGICGIGSDLTHLVDDHSSVERLLEEGAIHVKPMVPLETRAIFQTAEKLFKEAVRFDPDVVEQIAELSGGYPYLAHLMGKECVNIFSQCNEQTVSKKILDIVLADIRSGRAFPTLETAYQRAIGGADERKVLLHLFAEQNQDETLLNDDIGRIFLSRVRNEARDLNVNYVDQLLPRLLDKNFGPALLRVGEKQGVYEFANPILRLYVRMRNL